MGYDDIGKHWFPSNDNLPAVNHEEFVKKLDKHLSEVNHKNSLPKIIDEVINFCINEFNIAGIGETHNLPARYYAKLPTGIPTVVFATGSIFDFGLLFVITLSGGEPENLLVIHAPEVINEVDAGIFLREVFPLEVSLSGYIRNFINRVFLASSSKIESIEVNNGGG